MSDTKAPKEADTKRGKKIDWESVEALYRAGAASLRAIGAQYSVSEAMIRKKAKEQDWHRDLTQRVQQKVRTELVRSTIETVRKGVNLRTEREVVDAVAEFHVDKLHMHQSIATRGRRLAEVMMVELDMHGANRDAMRSKAESSADADEKAKLQSQMATTFPMFISQLAAAASAARVWITLEREAYGINGDGLPPPAPPTPLEDLSDDELDKRIANTAKEGGISLAAVREGAQDT